jgi:hypothetical protein
MNPQIFTDRLNANIEEQGRHALANLGGVGFASLGRRSSAGHVFATPHVSFRFSSRFAIKVL